MFADFRGFTLYETFAGTNFRGLGQNKFFADLTKTSANYAEM